MAIITYIAKGKQQSRILNQSRPLTIGRSRKNVLAFPNDGKISKNHCEIYYFEEKDCFALKDLGATNGTILNGNRIAADVILSHEDTIYIGDIVLSFKNESLSDYEMTQTKAVDKLMFDKTSTGEIDLSSTETCLIPNLNSIKKKNIVKLMKNGANFNSEEMIDEYKIIQKLGDFSFGKVYLVKDKEDNEFAMKIFDKCFKAEDTGIRDFKKVMNKLKHVDHSNCIKYHNFGVYAGLCYFTMDYFATYTNLDDKIAEAAPLAELDSLSIVTNILEGLNAITKTTGCFHGDLYPATILFVDGIVTITDYGIADWMDQYISAYSNLNSPWYISPEQVLANKVSWKTDQYSLGVIFFQLLTGFVPYHSDDVKELKEMRLNFEFPKPQDYNPNISISDETLALIEKLVADKAPFRFKLYEDILATVQKISKRKMLGTIETQPILPEKSAHPKAMFNDFFN